MPDPNALRASYVRDVARVLGHAERTVLDLAAALDDVEAAAHTDPPPMAASDGDVVDAEVEEWPVQVARLKRRIGSALDVLNDATLSLLRRQAIAVQFLESTQ